MSRPRSTNEVLLARSRWARLHMYGQTPDPDTATAALRDLTMAKARRSIREALLADPPLTLDQRHDLAALLMDTEILPVHVTIDGVSGLVCRCCGTPLRCGQDEEADK
jgi:hypothetical protein